MTLPVHPSDYEDLTGLEDFDPSTAAMPRIGINHTGGTFKDQLTGEEFPAIYGIPLGMVGQRIMWLRSVEDNAKPLCKSSDAISGYPNDKGDEMFHFPWREAGVDPSSAAVDEYGRRVLACESCVFTQWDKTGTKNKPPRCNQRYTIPILYSLSPDHGEMFDRSGLLSFKGSGITPWNRFMSPFARQKMPLYSSIVELRLIQMSRGSVTYSVPTIKRTGSTSQDDWPTYAADLRDTRDFLRRAPRADDDGSDPEKKHTAAGSTPAATPEVINSTSVAERSPTSSMPVVIAEDEPLPF